MKRVRLTVPPRALSASPPFAIPNQWRPGPVALARVEPPDADVVAAPLPMRGGMRIVVYNRGERAVEVEVDLPD
ncbi:MAG: hypothetical protein K6U87_08195 [Firmicutes bacterium]|nr:hypothetical protein [Bacillota bacterium]